MAGCRGATLSRWSCRGTSVLPLFQSNRFLERLRAPVDAGEVQRTGRVLAAARVLLGVCSLVAISVDPTEPSRFHRLAFASLLVYIGFSLAVLLVWLARGESSFWFSSSVHAIDLAWAAFMCLFTGGPNSTFFIFFLFALVTAAYRWGLHETLLTAAVVVAAVFLEALVLLSSWGTVLIEGGFALNHFIMRATYLLILGFFIGYLAEEEKLLKAESSFTVRVVAKARAERGMSRALRAVFEEVMRLFAAERLLLAVREPGGDRAFLWEARRTADSGAVLLQWTELDAAHRPVYLAGSPAHSWYARRRRSGWQVMAFDAEDRRLRRFPAELLDPLAEVCHFRSAMMASFVFGQDWNGRLFVLEPAVSELPAAELRFLQGLLRQLSPALLNIYLVRRLRSHAGAVERARVARALHDGTIQSLAATEMEVDVLRRQIAPAIPPRAVDELERVQRLLRQEVRNLRELMEQLKPIELTADELVAFLGDSVQKFRRETGIDAGFVSAISRLELTPRCCGEVARIVQEALVNVRKHSRARHVTVRLEPVDGACRLMIADDGSGFDFAGRLSHEELAAAHKGPAVIKERVRALGGRLAIESTPGRGACLEILIPLKAYG